MSDSPAGSCWPCELMCLFPCQPQGSDAVCRDSLALSSARWKGMVSGCHGFFCVFGHIPPAVGLRESHQRRAGDELEGRGVSMCRDCHISDAELEVSLYCPPPTYTVPWTSLYPLFPGPSGSLWGGPVRTLGLHSKTSCQPTWRLAPWSQHPPAARCPA